MDPLSDVVTTSSVTQIKAQTLCDRKPKNQQFPLISSDRIYQYNWSIFTWSASRMDPLSDVVGTVTKPIGFSVIIESVYTDNQSHLIYSDQNNIICTLFGSNMTMYDYSQNSVCSTWSDTWSAQSSIMFNQIEFDMTWCDAMSSHRLFLRRVILCAPKNWKVCHVSWVASYNGQIPKTHSKLPAYLKGLAFMVTDRWCDAFCTTLAYGVEQHLALLAKYGHWHNLIIYWQGIEKIYFSSS